MSCTSISIPNGYTHSGVNLFNVNDTVTYTCNTFYTLSGNAVASCLNVNGTWSSIPSCKLVFYDNVWFWMTVGLASLLALVLLLILLLFLIRYCFCHKRKSRVSEFIESQDRYGDSCGPCCGFVDYKGCCSLFGCCGFFGCCGGFCGCCRCCREFPGDTGPESSNHNNVNQQGNKPRKKKVSVRQTQTSPTPTDSSYIHDEKKKIAKMDGVYIISNNIDSTHIVKQKPKKVHTSATQTYPMSRDLENSFVTQEKDNKKKTAKVLKAWMPHTHDLRAINTSTK